MHLLGFKLITLGVVSPVFEEDEEVGLEIDNHTTTATIKDTSPDDVTTSNPDTKLENDVVCNNRAI